MLIILLINWLIVYFVKLVKIDNKKEIEIIE